MVEPVYFVCKSFRQGRETFAVAEVGKALPPGFREVSRPRTRTLSQSKALVECKNRQKVSDQRFLQRGR